MRVNYQIEGETARKKLEKNGPSFSEGAELSIFAFRNVPLTQPSPRWREDTEEGPKLEQIKMTLN
jgi:hypothetical protein